MSRRPTTPDRPPPPGDVRLSVVVPAYEEHDRIGSSVNAIREAFSALDGGVQIVVVDDGSDDGTADAARGAGADRRARPRPQPREGCSRPDRCGRRDRTDDRVHGRRSVVLAVAATGVARSGGVRVGRRRREPRPRRHPDSRTPAVRCVPSADVSSTGSPGRCCGLGTATRSAGSKRFAPMPRRLIFERSRVDGFAFDVELFVIVERNDLALTEAPVTVSHTTRSTVRVPATDGGSYATSGTSGDGHERASTTPRER